MFTQIALPQRFIIGQTQKNQLWQRKEGQFRNHFEEFGGEFAVLGPASEHEVAEVRIGENREGFSGVLLAGDQGASAAEQRLDDSGAVRDGVEHRPPRTAVREVAEVPLSEQRLGDFAPLSELKPLQNLVEGRIGHTDFPELFDGHFAVLVDVFEDSVCEEDSVEEFLSQRAKVFGVIDVFGVSDELQSVIGQSGGLFTLSEAVFLRAAFFHWKREQYSFKAIEEALRAEKMFGSLINHNYNHCK